MVRSKVRNADWLLYREHLFKVEVEALSRKRSIYYVSVCVIMQIYVLLRAWPTNTTSTSTTTNTTDDTTTTTTINHTSNNNTDDFDNTTTTNNNFDIC